VPLRSSRTRLTAPREQLLEPSPVVFGSSYVLGSEELAIAHADGTYVRLLARLAKVDVLILDDWGLAPMTDPQRRDVLEILEDRHGARSTVVTSQLPVENWHDYIAHPTIADAVLDRLVHNAHRLKLKGPSRRKEKAQAAS